MSISKIAAALLLASVSPLSLAVTCPDPNTQATSENLPGILAYKQSQHQKMFGYFRIWRDEVADPAVNMTSMADLPACLDLVFVFPYNVPDDNPVWDTIKNDYVPLLRAQGTKVVWSVFIDKLLDPAYPSTTAGYDALAQKIIADTVNKYGVDGLDVDMEKTLTSSQLTKAKGVFAALSKYLGPKSGTGKLLIYDTNKDGTNALFRAVATQVDYVLVQSYGRSVSGLQSTFDTYKAYIPASKYFIGFSFYEENGTAWHDAVAPMNTSRAYKYAQWQPTGTKKGGIFSYALDRDGVPEGQNAIVPTDYTWTRTLISVMNP
ncbi:endo-beta-N-acetylglucosaminidase family protein [Luteimonas panaciterrae]|uniref:endo-beta-N-acetylglucosaminidase family protein n=1 Tax=Luteimonas panaciterrae TaxID=363885 RepID=UPI001CFB4F01|nr:endo-beta-N-acetylglucosaminidase family protein [Luteimonas panaciterrae]